MTLPMMLTQRDINFIEALTQKIRLLSLRQAAREWWHGDIANARRRLRALSAAGLLNPMAAQARSLPPLDTPLIDWHPGESEPRFGEVAHRLKTRWRERATRSVRIYVATEKAANLLGGSASGQLKAPTQVTHDLGVSAVWLRLLHDDPAFAAMWRGEDLMAETRRGQKRPDAFIVDVGGEVRAVIEFGGAYDAERVRNFHEDCVARSLPYELW